MNEEVMEKARQLRAAGVPIAEIEKYLQSQMGEVQEPDPEPQPGVGSKILGALASLGRDIPGVEAVQAGARSLVRRQPYREALSDIRTAEDAAPTAATLPARLAGAGIASAVLPGGAALKGAQYGALSGALSSDPNSDMTSRAIGAGVGAGAGALVGRYGDKVAGAAASRMRRFAPAVKLNSFPKANISGTRAEGFIANGMENVAEAGGGLAPAASARSMSRIPIRGMAPVAEESSALEGLIGSPIDNLAEIQKAPQSLDELLGSMDVIPEAAPATLEARLGLDVPKEAAKGWKPQRARGATRARDAWFAEQFAKKQAEQAQPTVESLTLEDLLALSTDHAKKGGTHEQMRGVARQLGILK